MSTPSESTSGILSGADSNLKNLLRQYWGFDELRPLQSQAIEAGLSKNDSLLVIPTGGGKSLCYQVPPLIQNETHVVVSPLIALMKDQVDGLCANGYPAAALHSHMTPEEKRDVFRSLYRQELRLVFVSPERLLMPDFLEALENIDVAAFAIDEAHCISQWGHDFRPEYRQLANLRSRFRKASFHAFTATATPRVQQDIVSQLKLKTPTVLIGTFDRPNLSYRIIPRVDLAAQVISVLERHRNEAAIIYCLSRKDTESLAEKLTKKGFRAGAYHAGMTREKRSRSQEAFSKEKLDVIVATVAFGMGIDRSNVRCVIHAALPKSIEHYQQETGRAGRDGLEAECTLFYSAADVLRWQRLFERAAEESAAIDALKSQMELLRRMQSFCTTLSCRHRSLTTYFGQVYESDDCGACDVCLGEVDAMKDSAIVAQKILSCVARAGERFGVSHITEVLLGGKTANVKRLGHDQLSTYGILSNFSSKALTNIIYQLVDQEALERTSDERPILRLNERSWKIMKGDMKVQLLEPAIGHNTKSTKADSDNWEGVEKPLFESLRDLRKQLAEQKNVPAYLIFSDRTLREMARAKPASQEELMTIYGIGEKKLTDFGKPFLELLRNFQN